MRRDFDIFEKFSDGSTLWRACVSGRYEAQRKVQEFAEFSDNEFFLIDVQSVELLPSVSPRSGNSRTRAKTATAAG
jgi:hypothetical protein